MVGDQRSVGGSCWAAANCVADDAHVAEPGFLPTQPNGGGAVGDGLDSAWGQRRGAHGQWQCCVDVNVQNSELFHQCSCHIFFKNANTHNESLPAPCGFSVLPFHTAADPSVCLLKAQTLTSYCWSGTKRHTDVSGPEKEKGQESDELYCRRTL